MNQSKHISPRKLMAPDPSVPQRNT
jgi:hypothetical protein